MLKTLAIINANKIMFPVIIERKPQYKSGKDIYLSL